MKTLITAVFAITAFAYSGELRRIDEIMHDGRQIRSAAEKVGLTIIQDYGGSSDYGEWFGTVRRCYRIADPEHKAEDTLLRATRERLKKDIEERGWQVQVCASPERRKETDLIEWNLTYSPTMEKKEGRLEGEVIVRSVWIDGGYMIFIDWLEQRKLPNKAQ